MEFRPILVTQADGKRKPPSQSLTSAARGAELLCRRITEVVQLNGYHSVLTSTSFFRALVDFDSRTIAQVRAECCPHCGGRLDSAFYPRKPRGVPQALEKELSRRPSVCCSVEGCRKRTTPPSVCFLGRRVYAAVTFILLSMLRHGITDERERQLRLELHGQIPVDDRTLSRWREWWQHVLPATPFWRVARGRLVKPVLSSEFPSGLVLSFVGDAARQLKSTLEFLSPLSTSSWRTWSGLTMAS